MAIEGKVAKVLDARALIVNRGSLAGVQPEMRFKVLEEEVDVMDPDNDIFLEPWRGRKFASKLLKYILYSLLEGPMKPTRPLSVMLVLTFSLPLAHQEA